VRKTISALFLALTAVAAWGIDPSNILPLGDAVRGEDFRISGAFLREHRDWTIVIEKLEMGPTSVSIGVFYEHGGGAGGWQGSTDGLIFPVADLFTTKGADGLFTMAPESAKPDWLTFRFRKDEGSSIVFNTCRMSFFLIKATWREIDNWLNDRLNDRLVAPPSTGPGWVPPAADKSVARLLGTASSDGTGSVKTGFSPGGTMVEIDASTLRMEDWLAVSTTNESVLGFYARKPDGTYEFLAGGRVYEVNNKTWAKLFAGKTSLPPTIYLIVNATVKGYTGKAGSATVTVNAWEDDTKRGGRFAVAAPAPVPTGTAPALSSLAGAWSLSLLSGGKSYSYGSVVINADGSFVLKRIYGGAKGEFRGSVTVKGGSVVFGGWNKDGSAYEALLEPKDSGWSCKEGSNTIVWVRK